MRKLTKTFLSILSVAILSLNTTSHSFAASSEVNFDMTPMAQGTTVGIFGYSTTHLAPSGDWTTTNSSTSSSSDNQEDNIAYGLKIPTDGIENCANGQLPYVVGYKRVIVTKDANANVKNPNSVGSGITLFSAPDDTIDDINSTFDYNDTAPEGTLNGTLTMTSYYVNPMTIDTFNSSEYNFFGYVNHLTQEGTFTVTTEMPLFSAVLNCDSSANQGQEQGGGGGGGAPSDEENAKSPKTGASEVLLGTFLVALLASSFVIYKAIEKHRNTAQISEK